MGNTAAMRKDVKSMILGLSDAPEEWFSFTVEQFLRFGYKMSPLWLYGCWLVDVIMFNFQTEA